MQKEDHLYLKIQDILLTNLDEVTNSRFQINADVHHQGRAMLKEDNPVQKAPTLRQKKKLLKQFSSG